MTNQPNVLLIDHPLARPNPDPVVRDTLTALFDLVQLERDALAGVNDALDREATPESEKLLASECFTAHTQNILTLSAELSHMGMATPEAGDLREVLTRGDVLIGSLVVGSVRAALLRNVKWLISNYGEALSTLVAPEHVKVCLAKCIGNLQTLINTCDAGPTG